MAQTCTGDCLKCSFQQQTYCAAQISYGTMKNQEAIVARLDAIESKLNTFSSPDAMINPLNETPKGPGVENNGPASINTV